MATILIFTSELTPLPGIPTGGRGVRINALSHGLRQHGHTVRISFQQSNIDFLQQHNNISPHAEWLDLAHDNANHNEVIASVKPDCILFSPWTIALAFTPDTANRDIPIVFDLPASLTLENVFEQREADFLFIQKKLATLHLGDLFLVSNPRQKAYLYPFLMLAGVDLQRDPVALCPLSSAGEPPRHREYPSPPELFFGSVLWRWLDYGDSLNTIADYCHRHNGRLRVCAGDFVYRNSDRRLAGLAGQPTVTISGLVSHENFHEHLLTASAAVELYLPNPERELASTTRTVEYLHHGLPVIYSEGMYYSDLIHRYDAGWVIDPADSEQLTAVLDEIFASPAICARKGANAQRLATECFDPVAATAALARFCANPVKLRNKTDHISRMSRSLLRGIDNNRSQRERFLNTVAELNRQATELNQQATELNRQLTDRRHEISLLNHQLADCRHDLERKQGQFSALSTEYSALMADVARIKNRFVFRLLLAGKKILNAFAGLLRG